MGEYLVLCRQDNKANVLVLMIPLVGGVFLLIILLMNVSHYDLLEQKVDTYLEACLISSLRIQGESLEKIASRWDGFGQHIESANLSRVVVNVVNWNLINDQAAQLFRGLPGYKGRTRAIVSVVAEANQIDRQKITINSNNNYGLGIAPEEMVVQLTTGEQNILMNGWYRRTWSSHQPQDHPIMQRNFQGEVVFRPIGSSNEWMVKKIKSGSLSWDSNLIHPIVSAKGNGGFPADWHEGIDGNDFRPHRYAFYGTEIR